MLADVGEGDGDRGSARVVFHVKVQVRHDAMADMAAESDLLALHDDFIDTHEASALLKVQIPASYP